MPVDARAGKLMSLNTLIERRVRIGPQPQLQHRQNPHHFSVITGVRFAMKLAHPVEERWLKPAPLLQGFQRVVGDRQ